MDSKETLEHVELAADLTTEVGADGSDDADDDFEIHYASAARRRWPPLTVALALAAVAASGFAGGVIAQKHFGKSTTSTVATLAALGRRGGTGGSGAAGAGAPAAGGSGGAGVTRGMVKLIDGSNLYITDASGNTIKVTTSGARVTKATTGSVQDIHPGDTVTVIGSSSSDGTEQATAINLQPAGTTGGGGGGGGFGIGGGGAGSGGSGGAGRGNGTATAGGGPVVVGSGD